jgi:hypothetical protein
MVLKSLSSKGFRASPEGVFCSDTMAWRALTGPDAFCAHILPQPYGLYALFRASCPPPFGPACGRSNSLPANLSASEYAQNASALRDHLANSCNMRASLHFSPPFCCGGPMERPRIKSGAGSGSFLLGRSAQRTVKYACALLGRENEPVHTLEPPRYEQW